LEIYTGERNKGMNKEKRWREERKQANKYGCQEGRKGRDSWL
jgi:hypothetical protein